MAMMDSCANAFASAAKNAPALMSVFQSIGDKVAESPFGKWVKEKAVPHMQSAFTNGKTALMDYFNSVEAEAAERGDTSLLGKLQVVGEDAKSGINRLVDNAPGYVNQAKDWAIGVGEKLGVSNYVNRAVERVREMDATEGSFVNNLHRGVDVWRGYADSFLSKNIPQAAGILGTIPEQTKQIIEAYPSPWDAIRAGWQVRNGDYSGLEPLRQVVAKHTAAPSQTASVDFAGEMAKEMAAQAQAVPAPDFAAEMAKEQARQAAGAQRAKTVDVDLGVSNIQTDPQMDSFERV